MLAHFISGRGARVALAIGSVWVPSMTAAQAAPNGSETQPWHYAGSIYGYLPTVGGSTAFPVDAGGAPINVSGGTLLDKLKFTFQGSLEAHNGTWGLATDLVYLDLGAAKTASRDFTIGNVGLPAGTTAALDWDLKGWVWTLAGAYRVSSDPALTVDLLAGTRLFEMRERLIWSISGDLGPIAPAGRTGTTTVTQNIWDGIVGVKGRYAFGARREWALPFYLDVGAGQSESTVQAAAGISYAFGWGELNTMWRYLGYRMKSGGAVQSVSFNGPMVGAVFRW